MTKYTWFYSFAESLSADQIATLEADFQAFLDQWKTHGTPVKASIELRYGRFVIIQADPSDGRPSGCSIDSMRHAVEQILTNHGHPWLDNAHVYLRDENGEILAPHFSELPALAAAGKLKEDTMVYDHSLNQTDDLGKWEVSLAETWLKRYLSVEA